MASSDNLPILDQWITRPNFFPDVWLPEANTRDTTKFLSLKTAPLLPTKHQLGPVVSKRIKSRSSKQRSRTTYITVDVANFREMVEQVTGFKFGNSKQLVAPFLKPVPQRSGCGFPGPRPVCLPTLDTSASLLEQHQLSGPESVKTDGPELGFGFDAFSPDAFPTLD